MVKCKKCKKSCVKEKDMFYYRGNYFPGWVCKDCNALYPTKEARNGMPLGEGERG